MKKPKIIVILGPNAAGKTSLSIGLAKKFNGEIVSADSRQVYRGLNLGSGKVTKKEMASVTHYLLDVASPKRTYTVAHFKRDALAALQKIYGKNKIPLLVGGTGFYIDAVAKNITLPKVKPDKKLRARLETKTVQELLTRLKKLDPQRAKNIDPQNKRRLIRAVEVARALGKVPKLKTESPFDVLYLGVWRDREELKKRIHQRLLERVKQGMIQEVKRLHQQGVSWKRLEDFGLEYRYLAYFLQKKMTREHALEELERAIWRFAKRQWTWFNRNKKIHWIKNHPEARKLVKDFLQ